MPLTLIFCLGVKEIAKVSKRPQWDSKPRPLDRQSRALTTDVLVVSSRDFPLRHLGVIPFVCLADSLVPKQLPTVKAIAYRAVTFLPLFRIKLTRNNHCELRRFRQCLSEDALKTI